MLKEKLNSWAKSRNKEIQVCEYKSGEQYFSERDEKEEVNLYILDIQMKEMTGMEVAQRLRKEGYENYILFLTSFDEYVFDGYDVQAFNYLRKPVETDILFYNLDKILELAESQVYICETKTECIKIPFKEIICFSSNLHKVEIMTKSDVYTQNVSFAAVLKQIPKYFIQTHRSYIVNLNQIQKISNNTIYLTNKKMIPLARAYKKDVMKRFSDYVFRE